jgi:hypothetical protein
LVYDLLFESAWATLKSFEKPNWDDCGLHTWGQNLSLHPHLHCIVPAAGLIKIAIEEYKSDGKFFPVKALSSFRVNIVRLYKRKAQIIILESRNNLEKQWSFAKSLRKSKSVVEYLEDTPTRLP